MNNSLSEHNHEFFGPEGETTEHILRRQLSSSVLRLGSSVMQLAVGLTSGNYALVIEGSEELTDGVTYAAAAYETKAEFQKHEKKKIVNKARGRMVGSAAMASTISTFGVGYDIIADQETWMKPVENLDFSHNDIRAASLAIVFSGVVYYLNRHARRSDKPADKFIFRDSIRDFIIPSGILTVSAVSSYIFKVPHIAEYLLEGGSAGYGWWNTDQLYRGWSGISLMQQAKKFLRTRTE